MLKTNIESKLVKGVNYIISPYTHNDKDVVESRVFKTEEVCFELVTNGITPLSPILLSHTIASRFEIDGSFETWHKPCFDYLEVCDRAIVLNIDGIKDSVGAKAEVEYCLFKDKEVFLLDNFYDKMEFLKFNETLFKEFFN